MARIEGSLGARWLRIEGRLAIADDRPLDATNRRLLGELQADARLSLAELGRRVGLSAPAVAERAARLEQDGVIRGYHADVDPRALGYALDVVHPRPAGAAPAREGGRARAWHAARSSSAIASRARTATSCALHVRDVTHLEEVIDGFAAYGQTTTSIVQSSPVPGRGVDAGL